MRRIRDPQGRFVKTRKVTEVSTNYHRGHNSPTTNSPERYRKTPIGSSSTLKPKEIPLGDLTEEAIEGETLAEGPEDLVNHLYYETRTLY